MRILVRNLEFEGNHGATASERRSPRRFQVDLEVEAPIERAGETDRLADTIDYDWLCQQVVEIGTGPACHLLETLALRMAGTIASRHPDVDLTIEVRKLNPPCPGHPAYTAVRFTRMARAKR